MKRVQVLYEKTCDNHLHLTRGKRLINNLHIERSQGRPCYFPKRKFLSRHSQTSCANAYLDALLDQSGHGPDQEMVLKRDW